MNANNAKRSKMKISKIKSIIKKGEGIHIEFKECKNELSNDDRDDIRTNLIESYERIMAFARKHLPDKFYLEDEQRISLRDHIIREVASNILIHREYNNPFPAKFIIESARIYTENSNKPHGYGLIDPANFSSFPKNPIVAKFFKEIGRADELGSGVRNLFKYCKVYSGQDPKLIEEDIFKTVIPLPRKSTEQVTEQATEQVTEQVQKLLNICSREALSSKELMKKLGLVHRPTFLYNYLKPALKGDLVRMTEPDNPKSPKQKYIITEKGKAMISKMRGD